MRVDAMYPTYWEENAACALPSNSELILARRVQRRLFPGIPQPLAAIQYAGACLPAGEIGGDFYDFFPGAPDSFGFLLADVCGKGIAAALLMANLQAWIRAEFTRGFHDLPAILARINTHFFESTLPEHYATLFFGLYDARARRLRYVNCGHPDALLIRVNGSLRRLGTTAMPLGLLPCWSSGQKECDLKPGETLCVFSDGVSEAGIETGTPFGEETDHFHAAGS